MPRDSPIGNKRQSKSCETESLQGAKYIIIKCGNFVCAHDTESSQLEDQPERRLKDIVHLAELCVDLLQQNDEHHSEVYRALNLFGLEAMRSFVCCNFIRWI